MMDRAPELLEQACSLLKKIQSAPTKEAATDMLALSLMARDKRAADIAREVEKQKEILMAAGKGAHGQPGYVRDDTWTGWIAQAYAARSIATAILTYGGRDDA